MTSEIFGVINIELSEQGFKRIISLEIIKRYFYESGSVQEMLKDDTDLPRAQEILTNLNEYNKILNK